MRGVWAAVMAGLLSATLSAATAVAAAPALVPKPLCCVPSEPIHAIAVDGTTAYIGGEFRHLGQRAMRLALLDPVTAQPRAGFPGMDSPFYATVPDGSGGWYIGGDFTQVGGLPRSGLAHILASGAVDPSWTPSIDSGGGVRAMALLNGRVYVGGAFDTVNGGTPRLSLAAFDAATGAVDPFRADVKSGGLSGLVFALKAHSGSTVGSTRLYVGGQFDEVAGVTRHGLAGINLDAMPPTPVGTEPLSGIIYALAITHPLTGPPTVYAGGSFTPTGGSTVQRLAAFSDGQGAPTAFDPKITDGQVHALALSGQTIYAGGTFTSAGNPSTERDRLAAFDRTSGALAAWSPQASDPPSTVYPDILQLAVLGGTVYAAGAFTAFMAPGPIVRGNLAAFDAVSGNATSWDPDALGGDVVGLATDGANVLVGGSFRVIGGPARDHLAAIDLTTGQLTPFNPGVDGEVDAITVSGATLFIGGRFGQVGSGTPRRRLALFDLPSGAVKPFDPDISNAVLGVQLVGDKPFAAGEFVQVNSTVPRPYLAGFDPTDSHVERFQNDPNGPVRAVTGAGSILFAGGDFTQVKTTNRMHLASFDVAASLTGQVTSFNPAPDDSVFALALDGSTLYAGGVFSHVAGGTPRAHLAAFDVGAGTATGWDPGADATVRALALAQQTVFAGGDFTHVHGAPRTSLAAIEPDGSLADWNPGASGPVRALASSPDGGLVAGGDTVLLAFALRPGSTAAPAATAGDGFATISFAAAPSGGATPTYTVTSSPGGVTATGAGSPITVPGLNNGTTYTFTVTATNAAGVGPPSPPSNAVTPSVAIPPDTTPPIVTGFKVTNSRFAAAKLKHAKKGTTFVFSLSENASTSITVARKAPGRKKGRRCVKPTKKLKKRCTRYLRAGALSSATTKLGLNRIAFNGRFGTRKLQPGKYRATLVATDAAGNRSKPKTAMFTVVHR